MKEAVHYGKYIQSYFCKWVLLKLLFLYEATNLMQLDKNGDHTELETSPETY